MRGQKVLRHVSEVAGGTSAECAVVCCCCPCALLNLLVLSLYKLPAVAFRRILRRRRRKAPPPRPCSAVAGGGDASPVKSLQCDKDMMRLEKEMQNRFDGTGFWRSLSERETVDTCHLA